MSSTRFEPEGSSSGRWLYVQYGMVCYGVFYRQQYKQSFLGRRLCQMMKIDYNLVMDRQLILVLGKHTIPYHTCI